MNMRFKDMNPLDRYLSLQRWIAGNKAYNTVSELVDEVLRDKQAEFATAAAERRRGGVAKQPLKEMSLLDHLLQARLEEGEKHLTPKELRDEVMTFLGCECLHQSRQSTAGYSTGL
jgi:cytochrome P450